MNRENKRKKYDKGYYKNHPCNDTFTCKVCGRPVIPNSAGSNHRNHCPNCLSSLHVDDGRIVTFKFLFSIRSSLVPSGIFRIGRRLCGPLFS